ncbi:MAG: hypothetical protein ACFCAD_25305 [Pleurocapsa sp.]
MLNNYKSIFYKIIGAFICLLLIAVSLIFYPHRKKSFSKNKFQIGQAIELYEFLQKQPKDIMVASLIPEADNLPTFAQRSILVSKEYAIPYHVGYYFPFRQKAINLIEAQYSNDVTAIKQFIHQYNVDFFLLEQDIFTPEYIERNSWIKQHQPVANNVITNLKKGNSPALKVYQDSCSAFRINKYNLINASCILDNIKTTN